MKKPLVGAFLALTLLGAGAAPAVAVAAPDAAPAATSAEPRAKAPVDVKAVDFAGTVALSNCSGSVVRMPASEPDDPALVLSNGHCIESGFPAAGEVIVDQPSSRSFSLLNSAGSRVATLRASKIAYATMTDTDVSLYQLTRTYAQIESSYGIKALEVNAAHPVKGTAIKVVSGYWKRIYSCSIDGFAYRLKEGSGPGRTRSATPPAATPSVAPRAHRSSTTPPARSSPSTTPVTSPADGARTTTPARWTRAATSPCAGASTTASRRTR